MSTHSIMNSMWPFRTLGDICNEITDGSHFSPKPLETGRYIVNVKDMRDGFIDLKFCTKISECDFEMLRRNGCSPEFNDVLLSKDGTIGKVVVYAQNEEIVVLSSIAILRPGPELNSRFFGQVLKSFVFENQVESYKSGSALRRLVLRDIRSLKAPCPSLPEQRRISEILETIDEAIQKTEALISKLKAMKQGLLHDLLTRGLNKNDKLRDPKAHPEQFKDSPLGRIPREWQVNRLGHICELLNGLAFKPSDWSFTGIPIIRIQNLNQGTEFNYFNGVVQDKYVIPPDTLLFSWSGNRGTSFGPFIWSGPTGVLNQHIFKVTPREGFRLHWFYYSLDIVRQRVERAAHGGSGLVHIKRSDLTSYIVATPDKEEQKRIEETISSHDSRIRTEEQYRDKLKLQKKGLMHDLLTGKVRVRT